MMPVSPPIVKKKLSPKAQNVAGDHLIYPPCNVARQLKTCTPVRLQ